MSFHYSPQLVELDRQIVAAAQRVEVEIAIERKRRNMNAWQSRRARYLAETQRDALDAASSALQKCEGAEP